MAEISLLPLSKNLSSGGSPHLSPINSTATNTTTTTTTTNRPQLCLSSTSASSTPATATATVFNIPYDNRSEEEEEDIDKFLVVDAGNSNDPSTSLNYLSEVEFLKRLALVDSLDDVQDMLRLRQIHLVENDDAAKMSRMSSFKIAMLRSPAIILTLFLELLVGLVISRYKLILEKHILLTAFIPVISSVSGNIGLQASTATLRGLATGYAKSSSLGQVLKVLRKEVVSAISIAVFAGLALFLIALSWSQGLLIFALVTGTSIFLSASLAGFFGTLSPIFFKAFHIDPAVTAGPFETAVQDIVGISIFLTLAWMFLP